MRWPITTGPAGIVRTTWKFTALANVGTRTAQPVIDRHAEQIFEHAVGRDDRRRGARPQRREADRDGLGVTRPASPTPAPATPRRSCCAAVPSIWITPSRPVVGQLGARDGHRAAGDLQDVAGPGADAREIGRRQPRDGMPDVLDARFRDAQRRRRPRAASAARSA